MKYKVDSMDYKTLRKRATVNKFQRRLVWSKNEKIEFIQTLKNGYPFGSILIYKYDDQNVYSIIDGLQRFTTIEDFNERPHEYIRDISTFINEVNNLFIEDSMAPATKNNYYNRIQLGINKLFEKPEKKYNDLYKILVEDPLLKDKIINENEFIYDLQERLINHVNEYLNIEDISIPCIIFEGDETELATVFQNLNRGGKKLSKYQVFAAQWSHYRTKLSNNRYNNKVLEKVIKRYTRLVEKRNVDILDFNENEMRTSKEINLSEFCYALGILITKEMNVFWSNVKDENEEDIANEIGYSTLAIVLGVSNNQLHKIPDRIEFYSKASLIEDLVSKILNEYRIINQNFKKYLSIPGKAEKYEAAAATNFILLSYFASLWSIKYKYNIEKGTIQEKQGYKRDYEKIRKNMILYYINDLVSGRWSGSGDKKLNDIYIDNYQRYLRSLDLEDLEGNILSWNEENNFKGSIRFDKISKTLYVIYLSFYKAYHNKAKYDYEHIFPRAKYQSFYKQHELPLGGLGNLMLLDSKTNRSKQDDHILKDRETIAELKKEFIEIHEYPSEKIINKLDDMIRDEKFDDLKKELERRSKKIITNLKHQLSKSF